MNCWPLCPPAFLTLHHSCWWLNELLAPFPPCLPHPSPPSHQRPFRNQYGSDELVAELAATQDVFAQPALEALQKISKMVRFVRVCGWAVRYNCECAWHARDCECCMCVCTYVHT